MKFELNGIIYLLDDCTEREVPSHIEKVLPFWKKDKPDIDIKKQADLLDRCVKRKTAVKIVDNKNELKAFIYCIDIKRTLFIACLWFEKKVYMAMLYHYVKYNTKFDSFYFTPLSSNPNPIPFRFMLDKQTIIKFHAGEKSMSAKIGSKELEYLHKRYYLDLGIKVV